MNTMLNYRPADVYSVFDDWDKLVGDIFKPASASKPTVDIIETKDAYLLEAELPGFKETEVDIKIQDRVLSLSGKLEEQEQTEDGQRWLLRERRPAAFRRSFTLPRNVDVDKISASFKDGILSVSMPISPEAKEKVIAIKRG